MTAFEAPPPPRINALSGFLFSINGINDFSKPTQSVLNPIFLLSIFFIVLTAPIALATSSISSRNFIISCLYGIVTLYPDIPFFCKIDFK